MATARTTARTSPRVGARAGLEAELARTLKVEARRIMAHLRQCGVVVHHVAPMPIPAAGANDQGAVAVFLSKALGQFDIAYASALRMPRVGRVTFAGFSPAVMYVHVDLAPSWLRP